MKPLLEAPRTDMGEASLVAFERVENSFAWNWHYHPEMELTWIHCGQGTRLVGDHSDQYQPNDLVLLGSNLPHTWFSSPVEKRYPRDENSAALVVQFRIVPETLLALPEFFSLAQLLARASHGLRFSEATGRKMGAKMKDLLKKKGAEQWLGLVGLLNELASERSEVLASAGYHHRRSYKLSSRLERSISHIEKHCREEIPLEEIARLAGLTPSAFSRFFKKMTHKTFVDYRNGCRIREACRLLTDTDLSVTEIAYECGFNNLANFNRRFRKEKYMVPRRYRHLYNPVSAGDRS